MALDSLYSYGRGYLNPPQHNLGKTLGHCAIVVGVSRGAGQWLVVVDLALGC